MIRVVRKEDFDFIYALYMHPEVNPFLLYEFMDAAAFAPEFNQLQERNVLYIFEHGGKDAGMFKLIPYAHRSDHIAYLGGLAIHPDNRGKGLGLKMMEEIIALGKSKNLLRIELSTAVNNAKAIRLYEQVGFEREGVLRKYTHLKKENVFLDELMMAYLY
jgi:L-phenylalanine/L-methionine N-acetyltransferase